jgi:hypothetical protein
MAPRYQARVCKNEIIGRVALDFAVLQLVGLLVVLIIVTPPPSSSFFIASYFLFGNGHPQSPSSCTVGERSRCGRCDSARPDGDRNLTGCAELYPN